MACKTFSGQLATIFYAIVGIPLVLTALNDLGKVSLRVVKHCSDFVIYVFCFCPGYQKHCHRGSSLSRSPDRATFDETREIFNKVS